MTTTTDLPQQRPDGVAFDPPARVFLVNQDNVVIKEAVFELGNTIRAAIPNPWSETENYVIGVIRGMNDTFVLDVGDSLGKLELQEHGWVCVAMARIEAIGHGLALQEQQQAKSFTERLLKRAAKGKKR